MRRFTAAFLVSLVALAPGAAAHAAPDPPEYMTRLLHDYNDDWGSDTSHASTRDGHDLISLDLREEYNRTLGANALVFRLSMNFGWDADASRPELKEVLTFKAKGQPATREFKTTDNTKFTGTFDGVYGPVPMRKSDGSPDGSRFYVEGVLKFSGLGLQPGDKVSEFFVQGYGGSAAADHMVGGFTIGGQRTDNEPPSEQADSASYRRNEYTLRGPVMYGKSSLDLSSLSARPGDNRTVTWSIVNTLGRAQTFTASAKGPDGVDLALHGPEYTTGPLTFQVGAGLSTAIHVYVAPGASAKPGPIDLTLDTSLGGRYTHRVDLAIGAASATSAPAPGGEATGDGGKAPSPGILFCLAGIAAVAWLAPRRGR